MIPRILPQNKYISLTMEDKLEKYNLESVLSNISNNYSYIELIKK